MISNHYAYYNYNRGDDFRKEFSCIGELHSILPSNVKIMALAATATKTLRDSVINTLGMVKPVVVSESPDKPNLVLSVRNFESMETTFYPVVEKLRKERTSMGRILVYYWTQDTCAQLYLWMSCFMGPEKTDPPNAPDMPKYRLFDMFTACTHPEVKAEILHQITTEESPLRLVIATIAFGMGINTPDIRTVIHLGPPEDIEQYCKELTKYLSSPPYLTSKPLMEQCLVVVPVPICPFRKTPLLQLGHVV